MTGVKILILTLALGASALVVLMGLTLGYDKYSYEGYLDISETERIEQLIDFGAKTELVKGSLKVHYWFKHPEPYIDELNLSYTGDHRVDAISAMVLYFIAAAALPVGTMIFAFGRSKKE